MPKLNLPKKHMMALNAPLWRRAAALFIDLLVINLVVIGPFRSLILSQIPDASFTETVQYLLSNQESLNALGWIMVFLSILSFLYFTILERVLGQTLGKKMLNIWSVSFKGEKDEPTLTLWQSCLRNLYFVPLPLLGVLAIIDPFVLLFTKHNQRLCELLSQTKTVQYMEI